MAKPFTLDVWDLINKSTLEERIYRLRCVEAWSMVLPWSGIALADLIRRAEPTSRAKFVAFETLYDPEQLPGQASRSLGGGIDYPYVEGLRIDEAMHPLSFLAMGLYGKALPAQNGAPIRLVVPWKYGFKSIKSIVSIRLVEEMPSTTWNLLAPTNTASTPTSIRRWITRAGVRPASVLSARGHLRSQAPADLAIQWLCRRGGVPLSGYGSAQVVLRREELTP